MKNRHINLFSKMGLLLLVLGNFLFSVPVYSRIDVVSTEAKAKLGHIQELEFKDAEVQDAIRVISELTKINIIATSEAGKKVFTLFLRDINVADAIDSIARVSGLWYRRNQETNVYMVMTTEEYFKDIIVFREEKTKVFTLKYQNVVKIARTIEAMFGDERVDLDLQTDFDDDLEVPGSELTGGSGTSSGSSSSSSNRNSNRSGNSRNNGSSNNGNDRSLENEKADLADITSGQISLLEKAQLRQNNNPLLVSSKTLASVRKGSQVPIFVSVNREHNLLFVRTADEKALKEIGQIVLESDRRTPQVLLEMKVMSIQLDDGFKSAFDFSITGGSETAGPPDGQAPNPLSPDNILAPENVFGLVNAGLKDSSSFVYQYLSEHVRARVQILENEGRVNILATPLVLASNNRPAKIFIGEETVITTGFDAQSASSGGGNNTFITTPVPVTEVREIGNTLSILPSINIDRTVVMRLLQESSRVNPNGGQIPIVANGSVVNVPIDTVDSSKMEGTIIVKDGLTVVVGGMISETESDIVRKVPGLGDIPGLGVLFRDTERSNKKEELVLLITPHVLSTPEEAEAISERRLGEISAASGPVNLYIDKLKAERQNLKHQYPKINNLKTKQAIQPVQTPETISPLLDF